MKIVARPVWDGKGSALFTGIIEELGEVVALETHGDSPCLRVHTTVVGEDILIGASLAVNGVCSTVINASTNGAPGLDFDVGRR